MSADWLLFYFFLSCRLLRVIEEASELDVSLICKERSFLRIEVICGADRDWSRWLCWWGIDWLNRAEMHSLGEVQSVFKCLIMLWIPLGDSHLEGCCHSTCGGNEGLTQRDFADVIGLFFRALDFLATKIFPEKILYFMFDLLFQWFFRLFSVTSRAKSESLSFLVPNFAMSELCTLSSG